VLQNLGLLSEHPVTTAEGLEVVPLKLVKAVLPDPASLAPNYTGKTCIGDLVKGTKDGAPVEVFVYNVADHKEAFEEVGSQGISYTAGVPPVAAALLIAQGDWDVGAMRNVEELDPKPYFPVLDLKSRGRQVCRPAPIRWSGAFLVAKPRIKIVAHSAEVKLEAAV
jgi:saccharopine dehydrogenase-like NADP-dependent oxidoreductase